MQQLRYSEAIKTNSHKHDFIAYRQIVKYLVFSEIFHKVKAVVLGIAPTSVDCINQLMVF